MCVYDQCGEIDTYTFTMKYIQALCKKELIYTNLNST